ncbi:MAG: aminotransferase class V-fold PLP-dependent enzyme [Bradymonadaceae bacterium]
MADIESSPENRGGESSPAAVDWEEVRAEFPVLRREFDGRPVAYLDNAASSQMPEPVIERIDRYHREEHSNVHRGVHRLSRQATDAFEAAREKVADFIGAPSADQVVWTRGATEAINLVRYAWARDEVEEGDEIVLSRMEHHSNLVPWQELCDETGAELRELPMTDEGELVVDALDELLTERTKLVGVVHVSNVLGTINPVETIVDRAHERNIPVLVDGCQAVPHRPVDVADLGADFYVFSGHKMNGPTGIGALYARADLLDDMPIFQGGGEMIRRVSFDSSTYKDPPQRFEAGTPAIMPAVGLGPAVEYLDAIGMERIADREDALLAYATDRLEAVEGLRIFGRAEEKASVLSFDFDSVHPHDIGTVLDDEGVAIRAGHHCAQPAMERLGIPATARASLAYYNNRQDIDRLARAVRRVEDIFGS